ncbi:hypothetical protein RHSP_13228 [Rhizobium freirei PRF 81]|uniref:Uncharacterized protein n=1 Tax=Rhizobium freirei PRF 81 TaxID=363754 RepID=N6U9Z2_9HYPH|nr:hypothetical protein RHSP_13228 [Rhizobium freirei PRF 81]
MDREDDDRNCVFPRKRHGGYVHDGKALLEHLTVRQMVEALRIGEFLRIGGIDAVDLRALEDRLRAHFRGAQRGGRIGGEERVSRAAGKDHYATEREMIKRGALREALADLRHGNGREHDGFDVELAQRGCQRQRIDDGSEHSHVVAGHAVATLGGHGHTAEDIAAADHDADFDAHGAGLRDIRGNPVRDGNVDTETLTAHKRFAGGLEQYTLVDRLGHMGSLKSSRGNGCECRIHEGHRVVTRCPEVFPDMVSPNRDMTSVRQSALGDGSNFGSEVGFFLLDAFAEEQTGHAGDFDRGAGGLFSFLDGSSDRQVRVDDESLREKSDFLEELAHAAFHHLFDDGFRLAGFAGLLDEDVTLALGDCGIDFLGADGQRVGGSNVHGNLAADRGQNGLVADRLQGNQNAELADAVAGSIVDVGRHDAVLDFQLGGTTKRHVFADGCDRVLDGVGDRLAGCRVGRSRNGFDRAVGGQRNFGDAASEVLEGIVTGNEVGFGVELDDNSLVTGAGNGDQAFSGGAAGLLVGLGDALGAQPVDRGFDIAVGFRQRLLAVHHACARLFAQFFHQCSRNLGHKLPLVGSYGAAYSFEPKRHRFEGRNVPVSMTAL